MSDSFTCTTSRSTRTTTDLMDSTAAWLSSRRGFLYSIDAIHSFKVFNELFLLQHSMLYFFHHYELPVILQQAQLQQLLLRTHRGMGMMPIMGLAGIAALASGAAYHDAPGTGSQATPPTTQSTTQTVQNTVQSTTQTSPSVSTAQTNTTHTGDVISSRTTATETSATGTNTASNENEETTVITAPDKYSSPAGGDNIRIEEIARKTSSGDVTVSSNSNPTVASSIAHNAPSGANTIANNVSEQDETSTLDRRRKKSDEQNSDDPPLEIENTSTERLAPRASP
ncbi:unnamed protein product [Chilo suppressalis]|uniref:Uncharacterized protein n=1 Tax=Chilo suppressalis TaxID=168631 RepID=A0ABN8B3J8_CHISP|nr:unnamed protein product [Chilo suppressalis]